MTEQRPRRWMSFAEFIGQWYGVLTTAAVAVSALWLVFTGKHTLFVHPRYTVFIVEMSALALIASVWALSQSTTLNCEETSAHHHHHHDSHESTGEPTHEASRVPESVRGNFLGKAATAFLVASALIMVLLVPPAPLSANLAGSRTTVQGAAVNSTKIIRTLADLPVQPTTADWAQLLVSQTKEDLTGEHAHIDGFVTTDDEIAEHGYYLVRFSIICCAVDAFPARVPIYDPHWREHVEIGQWLDIEGEFQPSNTNIQEDWMLHPSHVTPIEEPEQPYLF